jgi:hypothetical protein
MPRFDSLTTSSNAPVTPADVAAAEAAAIAAAAVQSAADAAAAEAAAIAACAPNTVVAGNSLFHAFLTVDQAIPPGGFTETVICDQVQIDNGNNYNPLNGEWKCPESGTYRVQGRIGGGAVFDAFVAQLFVDAGPSRLTDGSAAAAIAVNLPAAHIDLTFDVVEGEAITMRVTETKSGTPGFNVAGAASLENTHLTIYRVR